MRAFRSTAPVALAGTLLAFGALPVPAEAGIVSLSASGDFATPDVDGTPPLVPAGVVPSDTWSFSFDYDTDALLGAEPGGAFYFNPLGNVLLRIGSQFFPTAAVGNTPLGPQFSLAQTLTGAPSAACGDPAPTATSICDLVQFQAGFDGAPLGLRSPFQGYLLFGFFGDAPGPLAASGGLLPDSVSSARSTFGAFTFRPQLQLAVPAAEPNQPPSLIGAGFASSVSVPEPSTAPLLALGLCVLAFAASRRNAGSGSWQVRLG